MLMLTIHKHENNVYQAGNKRSKEVEAIQNIRTTTLERSVVKTGFLI